MSNRSFAPLFATNLFGVVNDNFLKTFASFVAVGWLSDPEGMKSTFISVTGAALVLPYILCSPLADRLAAVYSKCRILRIAKWMELPIMALAISGFLLHSIWMVVLAVLLMGLQSSLYSPSKYALIRDIGGDGRISTGMGGMEGISFLGVLSGTVAASFISNCGSEWIGIACLGGFAVAGLAASYTIRADEEISREFHSINPVRYFNRVRRMAKRYPGLNSVIVTLSGFWWVAATLQMGLLVYGTDVMRIGERSTGIMLCGAAVGIVLGQIVAGFVDRRRFLLGATLLTGWIASVCLAVLFFVPMSPAVFGTILGILAFDLGFFKLPLDAEIQKVVKGPKLNTMLAYFNQVSFLFMFFASVCYMGISLAFGKSAFLLMLAIVMAVLPVWFAFNYRAALVFTGRWIFRRRYSVKVEGLEECVSDHDKAYLVLPNHPAMIDPMLVVAEFWRTPLRPLVDEAFFTTGLVAPKVLKTLLAVPVPDLRAHRSSKGASIARGLGDVVKGALEDGGNVIFYPSGHIYTENREDIGTRQLAYNICRDLPANVEVLCVRTTGLWGSIWSRAGRKDSPSFVATLVKSVLLWFFVSPFMPRRRVTMQVERMTDRVKEWSAGTRLEFNRKLEDWYNISE